VLLLACTAVKQLSSSVRTVCLLLACNRCFCTHQGSVGCRSTPLTRSVLWTSCFCSKP
jgi:hypothetical protein